MTWARKNRQPRPRHKSAWHIYDDGRASYTSPSGAIRVLDPAATVLDEKKFWAIKVLADLVDDKHHNEYVKVKGEWVWRCKCKTPDCPFRAALHTLYEADWWSAG